MNGGRRWRSRSYDTIRTGEIAYSIVTIVAIAVIAVTFQFGRLFQSLDNKESLLNERVKLWGDITNFCDYLNNVDYAQTPTPLIENIQEQIGNRLTLDAELRDKFRELFDAANSGVLGYLYPNEVAALTGDDIRPSVRRFVTELQKTPPPLLEARLSGLEPDDSVLIFSRKALLPLEGRVTTLRSIRAQLNALRTPLEWASVTLLPISIWAVWLIVLRPTLQQSLELQSRIEASERRVSITLASIGEAVLVVGADGTVVIANPVAEVLLGGVQGEVTGRDLSELIEFTDLERDRMDPHLFELLGSTERVKRRIGILRLLRADQERLRLIDLTSAPIAATGEVEQGVVLVLRDVTTEQKLLEQLHNSDKARAVVGLAAGLAHEFNNALAIISGAQELIEIKLGKYQECSKLVGHQVKAIKGAVQQSNGLIAQLLAIGSQASLKLTVVDIMEPLMAAIGMLNQSSKGAVHIDLDARLNEAEGLVEGDAAALQRVFLNLGMNSLNAVAGDGDISIDVTRLSTDLSHGLAKLAGASGARSHIVIKWRDNGCGISETNLKRVFEPFFTTRASEGASGLGLSIVRGIIVEHRGAIVAASEPDRGAEFIIYLPACELPEVNPMQSDSNFRADEGKVIRVLVVEDEQDFSDVLREYLRGHGFQVTVSANGIDAMEIFKREHEAIDVVVLDMNLPGKPGAAVEAEMRAVKPKCRIVASTGYLEPSDGPTPNLDSATTILRKPYALNELLGAIRGLLIL